MYRNYQEYENAFEKMRTQAPKGIILKKLSEEQFLYKNFSDKVEWYLCEEYCLDTFTNIFFGHGDPDSDAMSDTEIYMEGLYNKCKDIIDNDYLHKISVPQTAQKVLSFLVAAKADALHRELPIEIRYFK
jgi:hypothetical protein